MLFCFLISCVNNMEDQHAVNNSEDEAVDMFEIRGNSIEHILSSPNSGLEFLRRACLNNSVDEIDELFNRIIEVHSEHSLIRYLFSIRIGRITTFQRISRTTTSTRANALRAIEAIRHIVFFLGNRNNIINMENSEGIPVWMSILMTPQRQIANLIFELPGVNFEALDASSNNALMVAASNLNTMAFNELLGRLTAESFRRQATSFNSKRETALLIVIGSKKDPDLLINPAIILLENGANIEARNSRGETPLMLAVKNEDFTITRFLLDRGADINAIDDARNTSLILSVNREEPFLLELLLERGADTETRDLNRLTPIIIAAKERNIQSLSLLVKHGTNLLATDNEGNTALIIAVELGESQALKNLLEAPTKNDFINLKNDHGNTALILAVKLGNIELVKELLSNGADSSIEDAEGRTALMIADELGNENILSLLRG